MADPHIEPSDDPTVVIRYPARRSSRPRRPSLGRTVVLVMVTWGAAVAFVLTVASDTRIGPVIYRITKNHGVHLGDLYATLGCASIALLITVWISMDHIGKARRYQRWARRTREQ